MKIHTIPQLINRLGWNDLINELKVLLNKINDNISSFLGDSPSDGNTYGRKDGEWEQIPVSSGLQPGDNVSELVNDSGYLTLESRPFIAWAGILSQNGTNPPVVVSTLQDDFGGTIIHQHNPTLSPPGGMYLIDLSGRFTTEKTILIIGSGENALHYDYVVSSGLTLAYNTSTRTGTPSDDLLKNTYVEVRVYP
jgi:hypothetical protein